MKFPTFKSSIAYTEYAFIVQRKATEMLAMTEHPLVASHYIEGEHIEVKGMQKQLYSLV
jgi:hypothetical protein